MNTGNPNFIKCDGNHRTWHQEKSALPVILTDCMGVMQLHYNYCPDCIEYYAEMGFTLKLVKPEQKQNL